MLLWRRSDAFGQNKLQVVTFAASSHVVTRRAVLSAAGSVLAAGLPLRAQSSRPRLAAIDWAMLETAIAIGHIPVAACELIRFRADITEPHIPDTVMDLGLRGAPNLELLHLIRPDLILSSPYYTWFEDKLSRVAPVLNLPFYTKGEPPLPKTIAALHELAGRLDDPGAARQVEDQAQVKFDQIRRQVAAFADRPFCIINIGDARHMRVFGFDSLYGSSAQRIGLANAWDARTRFSFLAPVPIEQLADMGDARIVIVGAIPVQARRALAPVAVVAGFATGGRGRCYPA